MEHGQSSAGNRRKSTGLLNQTLVRKNQDGTDQEEAYQHPAARKLSALEKRYLLAAEHGDVATVKKILEKLKMAPDIDLDINCMDPLGRTTIRMSVDNENLDMLETLLALGVHPKDGLLHAINAEYVEAVELLLEYEEFHHREGKPYSWEHMDIGLASFTPEITPLILAAHKDNYEILKLLLDRGASLPMVHDIKCSCRECRVATQKDCLKHSRTRISSYKALASPSLICLSSLDPIFTAFELSYELRRLSGTENEFKQEYLRLQKQCQKFATDLVDQVRNSEELETVLTYDGAESKIKNPHASTMSLPRIEMAIQYKQKTFIAHANVQQLLMSIWYDGMADFRRKSSAKQILEILKIGVSFPLYAALYMLCPTASYCQKFRKPFFKFITHSFSYLFFLLLLILASQRVESVIIELLGTEDMKLESKEQMRRQRGQIPTITEFGILFFVIAHITEEVKDVWKSSILGYFSNMWNIIDNMRNTLYVATIGLRIWAFIQERSEAYLNPDSVYIPRESWDTFDPNLIADGCFAAGNIFAALKLVHMFSINQYLGPLQVSLGRMVIDIIKFLIIYTLVLFAFACGMNQLMWYYGDLERQKCYSGPDGEADWERHRDSCIAWRRFSNLFESSQTLFWASFGLIDIGNFDLTGIKDYTRFWGLLMFGCYSVINVVVLLNLLIAMMSNSYHIISERSDVEWKFARTKLFLNYFEEGGTLPPPFNCLPNVKHLLRLFCRSKADDEFKSGEKTPQDVENNYQIVMGNLVWRYITERQHLLEHRSVTEDDINEIRQDINTFRYQMLDVFQNNGMDIANIRPDRMETAGKKIKIRERRLLKDFSISLVEDTGKKDQANNDETIKRKFEELTMTATGNKSTSNRSSLKWRELIFSSGGSPIGKTKNKHTLMKTDSLKQRLEKEISAQLENKLRRKSRSIDFLPGIGREKEVVEDFKAATTHCTPVESGTPIMEPKYTPEEKKKVGFDIGAKAQDSIKQKQGFTVTEVKKPEMIKIDTRATELKLGANVTEVKPPAAIVTETAPGAKITEIKTGHKVTEVKTPGEKVTEVKLPGAIVTVVKPVGAKATEVKPAGAIGTEVKPAGAIGTEVKPAGATGTKVKPAGAIVTEVKPVGAIFTEVKPAGAIGTKVKPAGGIGTKVESGMRVTEGKPPGARVNELKEGAKEAEVKPGVKVTKLITALKETEIKVGAKIIEGKPGAKVTDVIPGVIPVAKLAEGKPGAKVTDVIPGVIPVAKLAEVKPPWTKVTETKPGTKVTETKPGTKVTETKPGTKVTETKPGTKVNDVIPRVTPAVKLTEVKPPWAKVPETKQGAKVTDVIPGVIHAAKLTQVKPPWVKVAEVEPSGAKIIEAKPSGAKAIEVKPTGTNVNEVKPGAKSAFKLGEKEIEVKPGAKITKKPPPPVPVTKPPEEPVVISPEEQVIDIPSEMEVKEDIKLVDKKILMSPKRSKTGYDNAAFTLDEDRPGFKSEAVTKSKGSTISPKDVTIEFPPSPSKEATTTVEVVTTTGKVQETKCQIEQGKSSDRRTSLSPTSAEAPPVRTRRESSPSRRGSSSTTLSPDSTIELISLTGKIRETKCQIESDSDKSPHRRRVASPRKGSSDLSPSRRGSSDLSPSRRGSSDLSPSRRGSNATRSPDNSDFAVNFNDQLSLLGRRSPRWF